jgi:hypothetical protein
MILCVVAVSQMRGGLRSDQSEAAVGGGGGVSARGGRALADEEEGEHGIA